MFFLLNYNENKIKNNFPKRLLKQKALINIQPSFYDNNTEKHMKSITEKKEEKLKMKLNQIFFTVFHC